MKKYLYSIGFLALLFSCVAHRKINFDEPRKVPKQKLVPPGTIWLRDSTFMDITEVRNLDWLEMMWWFYIHDRDNYESTLPDTSCFDYRSRYYDELTMRTYYLRHPSYWNYPAVGMTQEQAEAFCRWRTLRVNEYLEVKYKHASWDSVRFKKVPQYVEYRLPTKNEWEYASSAGLDYERAPLGYARLTGTDNMPVSITAESYMWYPSTSIRYDFSTHTPVMSAGEAMHEVNSGHPNAFGIYNLLGNVSEIISDSCFKGLNFEMAIDGSTFRMRPDKYKVVDSTLNKYDYRYTFRNKNPQPWLGFRCVCIVKQIPE